MPDYEPDQCPECGYDIFCKKIVIIEDYVWNKNSKTFLKVDEEIESELFYCPECDAVISEEESEKTGRVVKEAHND